MTRQLALILLVALSSGLACRSAMNGGIVGGSHGAAIGDDACALMLRVEADLVDKQGKPIEGAEVWELPDPQPDPPRARAYRLGFTSADGSLRALTCYKSTNAFRFWLTEDEPVVVRLMIFKQGFGVRSLEIRPDLETVLSAGSLMDGRPGPTWPEAKSVTAWQGRWYSIPINLVLLGEQKQ